MACCKKTTKVREFQDDDDDEAADFYGPLENRSCQDIVFLVIFLVFICGLGAVTYLAVTQGNPYRLVYGTDSFGNVCNQANKKIPNVTLSGRDLTGKSKVFFLDMTYFLSFIPELNLPTLTEESVTIICIKDCPKENKTVQKYAQEDNINLCRYDQETYVDERDKCPVSQMVPHISWFNRCVPKYIYDQIKNTAKTFVSSLSNVGLGGDVTEKIVSDLKNTWTEIGYLSCIGVGVALIVVLMMKFLAAVIVWTLVLLVIFLCLGATVYSWYSWYELDQEFNSLKESARTEEGAQTVRTWLIYSAIVSCITNLQQGAKSKGVVVLASRLSEGGIVILLILLVLRKRISLVVQLYKEAGSAIGSMPFLLLQPIWTLVFLIVFVAVLCFIGVFIETSGLPKVDLNTGHVKFVMEPFWEYLRWYNLFGILWISAFIVACQDLVVAGAVARWFFTRNKKNLGWPILRSIKNLLRYHLGSVAFGSFIIALVRLARLILGYVQKKLKGKVSKVADFILKCLQCCLWCFERFLQYLNRNAYIEIAIYGCSFCQAAKKAFLLIMANALRVAAINSIGDFVLFLGKLCTAAIVLVVGHELFFKGRDDVNYVWVPLSVACAFSFAISHCFLLVYEITIDTIFLCFCEDCERNDGVSRPYFMSKNLMKYLSDAEKKEMKSQGRKGDTKVKAKDKKKGGKKNDNKI